ncbi:hypothetical protein DFQ27_009268 [Actinomortierella ambigua]|uniref:Rho-GAP domain-containing protein n=1 Tax=Actinomortierella ambigua TaxID=1343610 RepID=A0A9P6PRM7_9FUNG|nr:hypothetical protein DFQ26_001194 [Actinomortierella ambigua]KAG0250673.1 hypothetical protein DFQ27_009268 [Actinomortierella ambigua]
MVVLCACNLPDPSKVDYDVLLRVILAQLEHFVENDYTVVMFAGGAVHRPSWTWLFKAYRGLNRRYKKNLKALYIVHPTTWARLILTTMNAVISPKFASKVHYVDTLSNLAKAVPLSQIQIPAAVYQHNLKFEETITLPVRTGIHPSQMFGVSLEYLMGQQGEKGLPKVLQDCISNLQRNGLHVEGLFRRSPSSAMLKQVRAAYDRGNPVDLSEYDIHISAVLLKLFLKELPEPIFPRELYARLGATKTEGSPPKTLVMYVREDVLGALSHNQLVVVMEVFNLLRNVADHQESNKMTAQNLALVMSPNMVRHEDVLQEIALSTVSARVPTRDTLVSGPMTVGTIVRVLIEFYDSVF